MKYVMSTIAFVAAVGGIWYAASRTSDMPAATPTPVGATFTAAQVAEHSTETDCYSIVRGSVYNLTTYVPKHPGGVQKIIQICGKDGTSLFVGKHGGSEKQELMLATLKIGVLAQ